MYLLDFVIFLSVVSYCACLVTPCQLDSCAMSRAKAEVSFGQGTVIFCRSLQNYLVCLRRLSTECIHESHVQQVLSRYSVSCHGLSKHLTHVRASYFENKNGGKILKTDDVLDDAGKKGLKMNKSVKDDQFDDIGEKLAKSRKTNNKKTEQDDFYDDIGDDKSIGRNENIQRKNKQTRRNLYSFDSRQINNNYVSRWGTNYLANLRRRSRYYESDSDDDMHYSDESERNVHKFYKLHRASRPSLKRRLYENSEAFLENFSTESSREDRFFPELINSEIRFNRKKSARFDSSDSAEYIYPNSFSNYTSRFNLYNGISEYFDDAHDELKFDDPENRYYWNGLENDAFDDSEEFYEDVQKYRLGKISHQDMYDDLKLDDIFQNEHKNRRGSSLNRLIVGDNGDWSDENEVWDSDSYEIKLIRNLKKKGQNIRNEYFDEKLEDFIENMNDDVFEEGSTPYQFSFDADNKNEDDSSSDDNSSEDIRRKYDKQRLKQVRILSTLNEDKTVKTSSSLRPQHVTKNNLVQKPEFPGDLEFLSNNVPLSERLGINLGASSSPNTVSKSEGFAPEVQREYLRKKGLNKQPTQKPAQSDWLFSNVQGNTARFESDYSNSGNHLKYWNIAALLTFAILLKQILSG